MSGKTEWQQRQFVRYPL